MTLSESIEAATRIVDSYPNGGRDAGKGYIGALAATLASYPRQVALRCAEPRSGILLKCKFLPTVADLVEWLEHETAPLWNNLERERRIQQQLADRFRPEVSAEKRERIATGLRELAAGLCAGSAPSPEKIAERAQKDEQARQWRLAEIRAEWGGNPPTLAGIPVSRELADKLSRAANQAAE